MHSYVRRQFRHSLALALLAGCAGGATEPGPEAAGTFVLRTVRPGPGSELAVPAAYAVGGAGDSVRVLGGAFTLGGGRWSVRSEQEVVSGGVARGRTLEEGGSYTVAEEGGGRRVLDLYPGRLVTADRPWTAVLAGDTLHYGYGVYVR
ncbi:MAG TPA: hypothetical protein VFQ76_00985, partial [Longimicrobiaceae bacterium]|nr:hypothetical protein [Longimicrobiaceae bacterium]